RSVVIFFFFFQAEDGIRDRNVTGVQTCALPISIFESFDSMEPGGIEPLTSCVQSRRAPSCAKAPPDLSKLNNTPNVLPFFLRTEEIQPHLAIRLPCYAFTPVVYATFAGCLLPAP